MAQKLCEELSARLERYKSAGIVDLKVTADCGKSSTTLGLLWTLNNVLRLDEMGAGKTEVLGED